MSLVRILHFCEICKEEYNLTLLFYEVSLVEIPDHKISLFFHVFMNKNKGFRSVWTFYKRNPYFKGLTLERRDFYRELYNYEKQSPSYLKKNGTHHNLAKIYQQ